MKSSEITTHISKNVDTTARDGWEQFTENSTIVRDAVSQNSKAKTNGLFQAEMGVQSSFKLGPCGQALPGELITSASSSIGPFKY